MAESTVDPDGDPWTVAIHSASRPDLALGAGVVIDDRRVLTCRHVVQRAVEQDVELWVVFPKAGLPRSERRVVAKAALCAEPEDDLALLTLAAPVPAPVRPARLRDPRPRDLVNTDWWAFGFPDDDPNGADASGVVASVRSWGWVLLQTESRYPVRRGFSGAGVWSAAYDAVVGLVGEARQGGEHAGDASAVTIHQAISAFPDEDLASLAAWNLHAADEPSLAAWGWSLATDAEAVAHWSPRGRGVSVDSEGGYRFRGRGAALRRIVGWLDRRTPDRRVLVVTGSPGVGKSAVLGRIVTTADAGVRAALPAGDHNVKAAPGSIACAVHAKGKSALDVAIEIAKAASAPLPKEPEDLPAALHQALGRRPGRAFNIVIDALDEAAGPEQARQIIRAIVLPVAQTCADVGAQLVVGTRRMDDDGNLLERFGAALDVVDLDTAEYFAEADLAEYALATLQLVGAEKPDNPYNDAAKALPVADRIAALANPNFLVAGLVARAHGLYDEVAAEPRRVAFDASVGAALASYLNRLAPVSSVPARLVLTVLAYAQLPGMSAEVWSVGLRALGARVAPEALTEFTTSAAANFLIETTSAAGVRQYRLFHQALNDAVLHERESRLGGRQTDERALTDAMIAHGRRSRWRGVDRYLLQSLPTHADRAAAIHELLADDEYLLHADLTRLTPLVDRAATREGRQRARMLQLTRRAIPAGPELRSALFSVTQVLERLGGTLGPVRLAPYRAHWAWVTSRFERTVLDAHTGPVNTLCQIPVDGAMRLASGGGDGMVHIWDLATGQPERTLPAGSGDVYTVCQIEVGGVPHLAAGARDGSIHIWNVAIGRSVTVLRGHHGAVNALCQAIVGDRVRLVSGGADGAICVWNPLTWAQEDLLSEDDGEVNALCQVRVGATLRLASAGEAKYVKIWDLATGIVERSMTTAGKSVYSLFQVPAAGRMLLAGVCGDRRVRFWEPVTGAYRHEFWNMSEPVEAVCPVVVDDHLLFASVGADRTVRLRHPFTAEEYRTLKGNAGRVLALCQVTVSGRPMLASASEDRMVRLWDPALGGGRGTPAEQVGGVNAVSRLALYDPEILATAGTDGLIRLWNVASGRHLAALRTLYPSNARAVCELVHRDRALLASSGDDGTVHIWDLETHEWYSFFATHTGRVNALCRLPHNDRALLAGAAQDGAVWIWDPFAAQRLRPGSRLTSTTGRLRRITAHHAAVTTVAAIQVGDRQLLVTGSADRTVRLVDTFKGEVARVMEGHTLDVRSVAPVTVEGRQLIASGGADQTVRLWDPADGRPGRVLRGHTGAVSVVRPFTADGRELIVSGSADRTVRIWDPHTGATLLTIPVYHPVFDLAVTGNALTVGLAAGILTLSVQV